ncbi:MAG: threonine/serine exporter family protein [Clostridioides sp.]|jgi:uncharacterized membrane protein YjjB (DUF3815 family)|nr:threonine/serine exporter family protein [Clostridioides sp.]
MPIYQNFIFAALATIGFSIFFNTPSKLLPSLGVIGGIGWLVYVFIVKYTSNSSFAGFVAGFTVSALSEVSARKMKQPAIVFVIAGILPLVPGVGLYNTVLYMIQKNYSLANSTGVDALLISSGISLGVLLATSIVKALNRISAEKKSVEKKLSCTELSEEIHCVKTSEEIHCIKTSDFDKLKSSIESNNESSLKSNLYDDSYQNSDTKNKK